MKRTFLQWILVCGVAAGMVGCDKPEPGPSAGSGQTAAAPQVFQVKGVIKKLEPEKKRAIIQHEEIPGYMIAMTMPFDVKDAKELEGLQPGDAVSFRMHVTPDEAWIDQVEKLAAPEVPPAAPAPAERPSVRLAPEVEELEIGDLVPNYQFTNELGQAIQLADFKGKAVALTFIFTRCPTPNFCPLMSKRFAEAYKLLTSMPDAPDNWHLLTISFDPHFDTPKVLKAYAEKYQYDPKRWNFISGDMMVIDAITEHFNLPIFKQGEVWDHKLRTVVLDPEGKVQKIFVYNEWTAQELADELIKAAKKTPETKAS